MTRTTYDAIQEYNKQERIRVGRMCRCGTCYCCQEFAADRDARQAARYDRDTAAQDAANDI